MYVIKAVTYQGPYESNEDAVCFNNNGNIKGAVCDGVWDTSLAKSVKQVSQFLSLRERAEFLLEHEN